jgi:hypothetical protein
LERTKGRLGRGKKQKAARANTIEAKEIGTSLSYSIPGISASRKTGGIQSLENSGFVADFEAFVDAPDAFLQAFIVFVHVCLGHQLVKFVFECQQARGDGLVGYEAISSLVSGRGRHDDVLRVSGIVVIEKNVVVGVT